jgi:hypothetical protein
MVFQREASEKSHGIEKFIRFPEAHVSFRFVRQKNLLLHFPFQSISPARANGERPGKASNPITARTQRSVRTNALVCLNRLLYAKNSFSSGQQKRHSAALYHV